MEPKLLSRRDYLSLALLSTVMFGFSLIGGRVLTMHESRLPQASREMFETGEWLVPQCGGRPWLERPPLPHWITMGVASLFGRCDQVWIVRIPPALMGGLSVLLVGWMAARWFGRNMGLLSGAILATLFQFIRYAWLAEEDIFLAAIVISTLVWFIKLEFIDLNAKPESQSPEDKPSDLESNFSDSDFGKQLETGKNSFWGGRGSAVLVFFVFLGLTNLVKGLLFGAAMVLIPMGGFMLWNADWSRIKRYVWIWGWLAAIAAATGWMVAASLKYPDLLQLWIADVATRTDGVVRRDPFWYYPVNLLWCLVPWTIPAIQGLVLTSRAAFRKRYSAERFLWCWAILPGAALSLAQHKHHHYLVPCLAPWAILGALGARQMWQAIVAWPATWKNPLWGTLAVSVPGCLAVAFFHDRIPGPIWIWQVWSIVIPAAAFGLFWGCGRANPRWASGAVLSVVCLLYCVGHLYSGWYVDSYRDDTIFLADTRRIVGDEQPIFINGQRTILNMFRHLFYLGDNAHMLHNLTFLRDERIREPEVYVIARLKDAKQLSELGVPEIVTESRYHERLRDPDTRWTLFRLKFRDDLPRFPNNVTYTAKQVMEREPGPYLGQPL
ncbi:MAG: hypothetical protein JWM11_3122 [Planctomycetaceae bacterium]|nr:hypothetical protein [Planctomycetaceae bacterium]